MDPTTRIVEHMNADHQDSLVRYLEHQHRLSSFAARNAQLTKVTLSSLEITTGSNAYTIALDPPMKSFSETRERLVNMDLEARNALGRDPITVKKYTLPQGFNVVVFITVLLVFIVLHRRANLSPQTAPAWIRDNLISRYPRVFDFLWTVQPKVFYPTLVIHIGELTYMARSRLAKHSVPLGSRLWWLWAVDTFIEGFGCFQRFDAIVAEEKRKKEKAKH